MVYIKNISKFRNQILHAEIIIFIERKIHAHILKYYIYINISVCTVYLPFRCSQTLNVKMYVTTGNAIIVIYYYYYYIFFYTTKKCIACLSLEVVIVVIGSVGKCVRETQGKNQKILIITKNEASKKNTYQLNDKKERKIEMDFDVH